ncbi:hypothetical protein LCGC14_2288890 [marine sediment metagenome]|uniref:Uncharacterized protein n=1 Tax=marine sediment metagenome TaxID=412755 RepID=A0A0F9DEE1_9ZZZZ
MSDYLQAQVCVNCGGLVPKRQSSQSVTCMRVPWWRRVLPPGEVASALETAVASLEVL